MATKLIVSREDVRERYSLEDRQDINDKIDSGLKSAHLFFQGSLGTEWEEVTNQTDVFYLNYDLFAIYPNNQYRFRLKRAFVRATPAPVIQYAVRRRDLTDAAMYTVLDPMYYTIDLEKGLVYVDQDFMGDSVSADLQVEWEGDRYFAITYSAGFDQEVVATQGLNDGTPAVVTPAVYPAPDWLKEAILIWMGGVLAAASNTENPTAALNAAKEYKNQSEDMIAHKKREVGFTFMPIS